MEECHNFPIGAKTEVLTFGIVYSSTSGGFGGGALGTALGTNTTECQGTASTPFSAWQEKEGTGPTTNHYQSITFMPPYKSFSFEVRLGFRPPSIFIANRSRN